jgi:hypothetical protein
VRRKGGVVRARTANNDSQSRLSVRRRVLLCRMSGTLSASLSASKLRRRSAKRDDSDTGS